MRSVLLALLSTIVLTCSAQLAAPNAAGVSEGHIHLMVADPDAQKKVWVDVLGAEVVKFGSLEGLKLPGIIIVAGKSRAATEGTEGSTVHHIGFLVKNLAAMKEKLAAAKIGYTAENGRTAIFPDKVLVEFTEDTSLKIPLTFHHIHLASTNQEKLRDWYVKTFGATASMRGAFFAAMIPGGEVDTRKADTAQAPTKGRALDHIGFEVRDLEAFCKKLQADGITLDMAYRDVPQIGLKIAFLTDPEGTRIELTEGLAK